MRPPPWPSTPAQALTQHLPLLALPSAAAAVALPDLYDAFRAAAPAENLGPLLALLLAKRATLYACALSTVYVAAMRSGDASPGLGERLEAITAEAVSPATLPEGQSAEVRAVAESLDATPQAAQAAALPLVFGALLASAYASTILLGGPPSAEEQQLLLATPADEALALARSAADEIQPLSTASVCAFAVNAELQAGARALAAGAGGAGAPATAVAAPRGGEAAALVAASLAAALVACAYLGGVAGAWPLHNAVNACVAIGVARVLQLPSLPALLAALGGLALYDAAGTLFTAAAAAPGGGGSVMEGVAQARLGGALSAQSGAAWQPGLLTVVLKGRVTDALGLGDVVAPAMLAGWCRRYDLARGREVEGGGEEEGGGGGGGGCLAAALGGYALGCALLEAAPPQLSRAALLFLVPSTAGCVLARLAAAGDLGRALAGGAVRAAESEE